MASAVLSTGRWSLPWFCWSHSATGQDTIGLLGHLGTHWLFQGSVQRAAFQPLFPKPVVLHGIIVTQEQDLALGLVELHTVVLIPLIQPVQAPLQSLPTLQKINTPTQLGVVYELTEGECS